MVCIFGQGDCKSKTTVKQYITNNTKIRAKAESIIKSGSKTQVDVNQVNIAEKKIRAAECCYIDGINMCPPDYYQVPICNGPFNMIQSNKAVVEIYSNVDANTVTEQQQEIMNILKNDLQSELKKIDSGDLAKFSGHTDANEMITEVINDIEKDIENRLTVETINDIININNQVNNNKMLICGPLADGSCNFDQNNLVELQISNYLSAVGDIVQKNASVNNVSNDLKNFLEQEAKGIVSSIADLFGEGMWVSIAGIVGLCFVVALAISGFTMFASKNPELAKQMYDSKYSNGRSIPTNNQSE